MAEHTPGPWMLDHVYSFNGMQEVKVEGFDYHALVAVETPEEKANALLIAAAPDLLEAAKESMPWINHLDVCNKTLRAIAKATGSGA